MFERLRPVVLRVMRVPPDPEPPLGAPGSVRIFRAGRRFYHLRILRWALTQVGAVVGIGFSIYFISQFESEYAAAQARVEARRQAAELAATHAPPATPPVAAPAQESKEERKARRNANRNDGLRRMLERMPPWVPVLVKFGELAGIVGFLASLPFTFAAVRLDWELRWYIVTDRSLRIRAGLMSLQESTMSFANLQQVEVTQGPLQRLLGIADVHVQSAGGGGGGAHGKGGEMHDSLHTGVFHGVDNAHEIRDLILARLKNFRAAGLGDPDDHHAASPAPASADVAPASADALAAARELLAEARALRTTVSAAD